MKQIDILIKDIINTRLVKWGFGAKKSADAYDVTVKWTSQQKNRHSRVRF